MHNPALLATLTAVLAALPSAHAGFYGKSSPVLQINGRSSYDKLIANSKHTSIVEFYAPWCGHCQNLKPAYEKAAQSLDGVAKVAAVDCDDESNKAFCGSMGVQGFPTLKIVRPSKSGGYPVVEDYQGARTAKAITEAVWSKINNYVSRVTDNDLDDFLEAEGPKIILFSQKGTTSALLRSLAIDYLDVAPVAQIRDNQKAAVEKFGIDKFPTMVLVPGGDEEPLVYSGEMKKQPIIEFLSKTVKPNEDGKASKAKPKTDKSKSEKPKAEKKTEESSSTTTIKTAERAAPSVIPIQKIATQSELEQSCLVRHAHTCVIAFTPSGETELGEKAVGSLEHLHTKYTQGRRQTFPFISIATDSEAGQSLPSKLGLEGEVNVIAINVRRGWWRKYNGDLSNRDMESWIDAIRMGEGDKNKLPKGVIVTETKEEEAKEEVEHNEL